jgi:hypothetical protein
MNIGKSFTPVALIGASDNGPLFLAPISRDGGGVTNRSTSENEPELPPQISFC